MSGGRDARTATCNSFRLTIFRPEATEDGTVERLAGSVELLEASSVKIALALFAQFQKRVGHTGIAGEAPIAGREVTVNKANGSFTLELPAVARSSSGPHLRIDPSVIATSDAGHSLRIVLPNDWQDRGAYSLCARGLPRTVSTMSPRLYVFFVAIVLFVAGGALLAAGAPMDVPLMYQGGTGLLIFAGVVALVTRRGALGWLRAGEAWVTLEEEERSIRVRVRAGSRATGGRALLRAAEYEIHEGSNDELAELAVREAALSKGDGRAVFVATIPLPDRDTAPPSLALRHAGRTVGVRWAIVVELTTRSGSVARFDVPVSIGIVA